MIPLSWTAIKDAQCPFRFNALRIAKTYKEPQGEAAEIGAHVAEILKVYREVCFKKGVTSDVQFLLGIATDKNPDPQKTVKILDLIERFINTDLVNIPLGATWMKIESKVAFDHHLNALPEKDGWYSKDVAFRMVSDFSYVYDGALWIIDDKTGRGQTDKRQLDYYAHLLQIIYNRAHPVDGPGGYTRVVCVVDELAKGRVEVVAEYPKGPVEGIREEIMQHLARVNAWTEYPAVACDRCQWCTVPGCPVRGQVETGLAVSVEQKQLAPSIPTELTSQEEAEKAVMFILFAEQITDRIKELLRSWVQQHGPVAAGGKVAEERPNNPWKVTDLHRLAKTLTAFGVQPEALWKSMSLSESELDKLVKRAKIQAKLPMLLTMGERKEYKPKFGLYTDKLT